MSDLEISFINDNNRTLFPSVFKYRSFLFPQFSLKLHYRQKMISNPTQIPNSQMPNVTIRIHPQQQPATVNIKYLNPQSNNPKDPIAQIQISKRKS